MIASRGEASWPAVAARQRSEREREPELALPRARRRLLVLDLRDVLPTEAPATRCGDLNPPLWEPKPGGT